MIFKALIVLPILLALIVFLFAIPSLRKGHSDLDDVIWVAFGVFFVSGMFCLEIIEGKWYSHSRDLALIFAQDEVIQVYEREVIDLNKRLAGFEYPEGALMNSDTPVSSIVHQVSVWQEKLARARADQAEAKRSIEHTRYGLLSGVIDVVGDYK